MGPYFLEWVLIIIGSSALSSGRQSLVRHKHMWSGGAELNNIGAFIFLIMGLRVHK